MVTRENGNPSKRRAPKSLNFDHELFFKKK